MDRKIGKRINYLMNHHRAYTNVGLKQYDLTYSEASVLLNIYHCKSLNQEELKHLLLLDKARVSRVVSQLREKQYIIKRQSSKDKRYFDVSLTQKGMDSMLLIKAILDESAERMLSGINSEDVDYLIKMLDLMCTNVGKGEYK